MRKFFLTLFAAQALGLAVPVAAHADHVVAPVIAPQVTAEIAPTLAPHLGPSVAFAPAPSVQAASPAMTASLPVLPSLPTTPLG
ncbi:MAG: hypothetical protein ACRD0C_01315 [Acidimicrobiia bacterium]